MLNCNSRIYPAGAQNVAQHFLANYCHKYPSNLAISLQIDAEASYWVAFPIMAIFW